MSRRRLALVAAVAVLLAASLAQSWINSHTVNLVVVNASGMPVEISWQPAPGAPSELKVSPGCASHSLELSRGTSWQVARDGDTLLDSATAGLPLLDSLVAVEVWLEPDGSVRIVPPHVVADRVGAPHPNCGNAYARP